MHYAMVGLVFEMHSRRREPKGFETPSKNIGVDRAQTANCDYCVVDIVT